METDKLPHGYTKNLTKGYYIGKMSDKSHNFILDQINRRERLNYEENGNIYSDESDDDIISE